jgi:hypothetical protein
LRRGEGRQVELPPEALAQVPAEQAAGPSGAWDAVLERLTEEERQILAWRGEGLTWEEIAGRRKAKLSTVYQRFMKRLREAFGLAPAVGEGEGGDGSAGAPHPGR